MKNMLLVLFAMATTMMMHAQNFTAQKVSAESVPQVVRDAQAADFPETTVTMWEKQTKTGVKGNTGIRFVAIFQLDGAKTRARYYNDGKGISATSYLTAKQLPQAVQDAAKANYAAYTLTSGEKIQVMSKGTVVYRVRLRKGAQKLVAYVDENGKEVSKDKVPAEIKEDETAG